MKKILIADDEMDIIKVIKFRLSKAGYDIIVTTDGQEALKKIREIKPDLVILDYSMPLMNGDEVCEHIKKDPATRNIPVIMITASIKKVEEDHINTIGIDARLLKPFDPEVLLAKIKIFIK